MSTSRIIYDMSFADYQGHPALSCSALRKLAQSPLTYWTYSRHNPNRPPDEEKKHLDYGRAAHALILEGERAFNARYCAKKSREDYPEHLGSGEELAEKCVELGVAKGGTLAQRASRIRAAEAKLVAAGEQIEPCKLWIEVEDAHRVFANGRQQIDKRLIERLEFSNDTLRLHDTTRELLTGGRPEVSIFWTDEETGVELKARLDYLKSPVIVDLKTFSNIRGLHVDDAVAQTVAAHKYGLQAVMYCDALKAVEKVQPQFTFIFLESGPVPNVVVRHLAAQTEGETSVYWANCHRHYRHLIGLYQHCVKRWGFERAWAEPVFAQTFLDEDLPSWALDYV